MAETMANDTAPSTTVDASAPKTAITLRIPSKYMSSKSSATPPSATTTALPLSAPSTAWLSRTWSVTHSTLSMWRSARNVRITYKPLSSSTTSTQGGELPPPIDDLVEYEDIKSGKYKTVQGVDKPDSAAGTTTGGGGEGGSSAWNWRGKGWLKFVTSHWEVLGWGELPLEPSEGEQPAAVERWVVTWFAPTIFTAEGLDIYCDRPEGLSKRAYEDIRAALLGMGTGAEELVTMVGRDMREVEIRLPWKEGK